MVKIEVSPTKMFAFETCPKQFYLRYYKKEKPPVKIEKIMHTGTLVHNALELLAEQPDFEYIDMCVMKSVEDVKKMDIVPTQDMIQEAKDMIKNWWNEDRFKNETIATEYKFQTMLDDDLVIMGFIDRIEKVNDNTIKVIDYKTGNAIYRYDDIKDSNQLIMYAMAVYDEFAEEMDLENIVISYDMVRLNKHIDIPVKKKDFEAKYKHIKSIYKRMKDGEHEAIISDRCAYCWYKHTCQEYKDFLTTVLDIKTIEDIFHGDFVDSIRYLKELDDKKKIIDKHVTEVKSLILTEMLGNGMTKVEYGDYTVSLVSRKSKNYYASDVIDVFSDDPDELSEIISVKNGELEKRLHGLPEDKRDKILEHLKITEGNSYLKITQKK